MCVLCVHENALNFRLFFFGGSCLLAAPLLHSVYMLACSGVEWIDVGFEVCGVFVFILYCENGEMCVMRCAASMYTTE